MELLHRLPYESLLTVMRYTPHPAVHHLRASEKFRRLADVAQGWYEDWEGRRDRMFKVGLPVRILDARIDPYSGFFAVYVDAQEDVLIRSHDERGFDLHITIGFESDFPPGHAQAAATRINAKWAGSEHTLRISWLGNGGAAYIHDWDYIAHDPDIALFHSRGWYKDRGLHMSL
jgi:hypothetical protein